jgi:hypothetical protein
MAGMFLSAVQCMLDAEQLGPEQLGYDRPSSKLLAFLRKHYGLASYVPQPNNVGSTTAWVLTRSLGLHMFLLQLCCPLCICVEANIEASPAAACI